MCYIFYMKYSMHLILTLFLLTLIVLQGCASTNETQKSKGGPDFCTSIAHSEHTKLQHSIHEASIALYKRENNIELRPDPRLLIQWVESQECVSTVSEPISFESASPEIEFGVVLAQSSLSKSYFIRLQYRHGRWLFEKLTEI
jgi:hypothetical protein